MIFLNQIEKLKDAFEKISRKDYFLDAICEFDKGDGIGKNIFEYRSEDTFLIKGKDKVSLSVSVDLSKITDIKKRAVLATFLAHSLDNIKSKNVSAEITSNYSVPRRIENIFNHIKPKYGQARAMKECVGVDFEGERPFSWGDAKLKGFTLNVELTQNLHSFDSKQIDRQKSQMLRDLHKNICYHLEQSLFRAKNPHCGFENTDIKPQSYMSN
jgi:hypothetical protein